jgi:hypothetical protein
MDSALGSDPAAMAVCLRETKKGDRLLEPNTHDGAQEQALTTREALEAPLLFGRYVLGPALVALLIVVVFASRRGARPLRVAIGGLVFIPAFWLFSYAALLLGVDHNVWFGVFWRPAVVASLGALLLSAAILFA